MTKPTPEHVAMRDQIIVLLRDRSLMTTKEIGEALQRPSVWHGLSEETLAALREHIGAPIRTMRRTFYWEVYPQLAAMAHLGILQKVSTPGTRQVAWMLTGGSLKRGETTGGEDD